MTALRPGPLSGQDLSLLKTRSVVSDGNGNLATVSDVVDGWVESDLGAAEARDLTYIGERDPSDPSRILAPEGGWTENPIGARQVHWWSSRYDAMTDADELVWHHGVGDPDTVIAFKLIDAAPDHVGEVAGKIDACKGCGHVGPIPADKVSCCPDGKRYNLSAQYGEAAEVVDPKDETIRELLSALQVVRMSFGWQTLSDETKALIDAAILKATGGKDD